MDDKKRILFIGAHNDECEYGTGGIAKLLHDRGHETIFLNVACKRYTPRSEERLRQEEAQEFKAAEILGAKKMIIGDRTSNAYAYTPENTALIMDTLCEIDPDIVFIHWPEDNHIEHAAVSKSSFDALCLAAVRAKTPREVYAFEAGPDQTMAYFYPDIYINIESVINSVRDSLLNFDMEHANGQELWEEKEICAGYRGHLVGCKYAETLKIIKFPTGFSDAELLLPKLLDGCFCWHGVGMYPWGKKYFLRP